MMMQTPSSYSERLVMSMMDTYFFIISVQVLKNRPISLMHSDGHSSIQCPTAAEIDSSSGYSSLITSFRLNISSMLLMMPLYLGVTSWY